jgi:hypothetical protein
VFSSRRHLKRIAVHLASYKVFASVFAVFGRGPPIDAPSNYYVICTNLSRDNALLQLKAIDAGAAERFVVPVGPL